MAAYGSFLERLFGEEDRPAFRQVAVGRAAEGAARGEEAEHARFCDNSVSTAKYNVVTFIPRSLLEQFRRVANLYFLGISILMILGTYTSLYDSPLTPWSTLIPLILVLAITMGKEGIEDMKRHRSDHAMNNRLAKRLATERAPGVYEDVRWKDLAVGDIVQLHDREEVPADVVLLATSEANGVGYVETSNIDGETNLKIRQSAKTGENGSRWSAVEQLHGITAQIECEHPSPAIHAFEGNLRLSDGSASVSLDRSNLLLRGASMRNVKWALGVVVYTGEETKLVMNAREAPSKLSSIEVTINSLIYVIFGAQVVLSAICLVAYIIWRKEFLDDLYYLCYGDADSSPVEMFTYCEDESTTGDAGQFFVFLILFNNFVPISLYVTVEVVNYVQAFFIGEDLNMYYAEDDVPAIARTSNMNGDLGQIEHIFSDKTGTLTQNVMRFKRCSVAGHLYGHKPKSKAVDGGLDPSVEAGSRETANNNDMNDGDSVAEELSMMAERATASRDWTAPETMFLLNMAVCHTAVLEQGDEDAKLLDPHAKPTLQAESPDEEALVSAAGDFGFEFVDRTPSGVVVRNAGRDVPIELLNTITFNSTRKRMTTVVRLPDGRIILFSKGADNVMLERAGSFVPGLAPEKLRSDLEIFACDGLRTLVLAYRVLSEDEYASWSRVFHDAEVAVEERSEKVAEAAKIVEKDWTIIGATAIEDKLQDGVPETIADLAEAGIKLWVLTGDKMETAINIGYSCRLLERDMVLIKLKGKEDNPKLIKKQLKKLVNHFGRLADHPTIMERIMAHFQRVPSMNRADSTGGGGRERRDSDIGLNFGGFRLSTLGIGSGGSDGAARGGRDERDGMGSDAHLPEPLLQKPGQHITLDQMTSDCLALIVDGPALAYVFGDKEAEDLLLKIAQLCRAVIACRVSPAQKRSIVRLVKKKVTPKPITLAIGDGANDVGMIQEAQIGVGISGKEGRQAVNSSDFAIGQFRYLQPLLLVHGRWNYRRVCKVVLYSFYKNIVLTFILFFYTFYTGFSGQSLFQDIVYSGFNFFLALPVVGFGVFDQDVKRRTVNQYPGLYISGREHLDMNVKVLFQWLAQAIFDSFIIYFFCYVAYELTGGVWEGDSPRVVGLYVFGTTVYSCLLMSMLYRAAVATYTWNWVTIFFWMFSLAFYVGFLAAYSNMINFAYDFYGITFDMFDEQVFWLLLLLVPTITFVIEVARSYIGVEFFTDVIDHAMFFDRANYGEEEAVMLVERASLFVGEAGEGIPRARRTQYKIAKEDLQALNDTVTTDVQNELGITDTEAQGVGSSYTYDHIEAQSWFESARGFIVRARRTVLGRVGGADDDSSSAATESRQPTPMSTPGADGTAEHKTADRTLAQQSTEDML